MDTGRQAASIGRAQTENVALLQEGKITCVGRFIMNGAKKTASPLVVEFATKNQINRAIREGLFLGTY